MVLTNLLSSLPDASVGEITEALLSARGVRLERIVSSRFWSAEDYEPGRPQPSFDKQPLRDFLEAERRAGRWNGEAPAPHLPLELVQATSRRYQEAFRRLTSLDPPSTAGR